MTGAFIPFHRTSFPADEMLERSVAFRSDLARRRTVRELASRPIRLIVLICSSFPASQFASRAIEAGAAGYICKTAGGKAVLAALRTLAEENFTGDDGPH